VSRIPQGESSEPLIVVCGDLCSILDREYNIPRSSTMEGVKLQVMSLGSSETWPERLDFLVDGANQIRTDSHSVEAFYSSEEVICEIASTEVMP